MSESPQDPNSPKLPPQPEWADDWAGDDDFEDTAWVDEALKKRAERARLSREIFERFPGGFDDPAYLAWVEKANKEAVEKRAKEAAERARLAHESGDLWPEDLLYADDEPTSQSNAPRSDTNE